METDNPVAGFVTFVLAFFLFYVLAFGSSGVSPIATNATIQSNYQTAFNNVVWFVKLMPILFFSMLVEWATTLEETSRFHGNGEFMHNFQSTLKFYTMLTVDIFKVGHFFFITAFDIATKIITAIKGQWAPAQVAGNG